MLTRQALQSFSFSAVDGRVRGAQTARGTRIGTVMMQGLSKILVR
ncbi:MAG TPA: hypothetical protein V6D09_11400 [Leptolyngbyaceae cyanobacterium]